jgi:hypothetical protein
MAVEFSYGAHEACSRPMVQHNDRDRHANNDQWLNINTWRESRVMVRVRVSGIAKNKDLEYYLAAGMDPFWITEIVLISWKELEVDSEI